MGLEANSYALLFHALSGASGAASAYQQSAAIRAQGGFEGRAAETNARMADRQAQDAILRGERDAGESDRRAAALAGAQRATLAAQGLDLGSGTAASVLEDTAVKAARDATTIRNNAYREAYGYDVQAADLRTRGRLAQIGAKGEARQTLLGGFAGLTKDLARGFYLYDKLKKPGPKTAPADSRMNILGPEDLRRIRARNPSYNPNSGPGLA